MKTIEELLKNLARPEVLEFGLVTNRLPSVNIGGKFEPVDDEAPTTDKLLHMLATMGGTRHVESLSEKPVQWTTRLDGVGVIAVAAIMRKDVVQARFTVARRDPGRAAVTTPRNDVAKGPPPSGRGLATKTPPSDAGARPSTPQLQVRPASSGAQLAARPQPQSSGQVAVVKPASSSLSSRLAPQTPPRGGVWQDDDEVTVQTISPPVTGTPGGGSAEPRPKPARRPESIEEKTPVRVEPTAQERAAVHGGGRRISTPTSVDAVELNEARKSVPVPAANPIATQVASSGSSGAAASPTLAKSAAVAQTTGAAASSSVVSSGPQTPAYGSAAVAVAPSRGVATSAGASAQSSPAAGVAVAPAASQSSSAAALPSPPLGAQPAPSSAIAAQSAPSPTIAVSPGPIAPSPQSPSAPSTEVAVAPQAASLPAVAPSPQPAAQVSPAGGVATSPHAPPVAAAQPSASARPSSPAAPPAEPNGEGEKERPKIDTGATLDSFLAMASAARASDIHVVAGRPVLLRVATDLLPRTQPLSASHVDKIVRDIVPTRLREALEAQGSCDFAVEHPQYGRFRVNVSRQRTGFKMSMRVVPRELPTLASLGLPEALAGAVKHRQGIVLVTGPAGHGKTATLAALVDLVNRESARHVLTIEDPIEYVHPRKRGTVSHREVGLHARSFTRALEAGLREDADVIVVGEVRDLETTRVALAAAEAGHLVLATMNARGAASAIARLIDVFPAASQPRVRAVVAGALRMIVGQRLVPSSDRSKVHLACELVPASIALHGLVRDGKMDQVPALLQRGKALGIVRLDESLGELVRGGKVTVEIAKQSADSVSDLEALVARASQASQLSAQRKN